MDWSNEAKETVLRIPFFVRKRVRKKVEEEAKESGAALVTIEHVRSCQKKFLNKMEDELKGYQLETCFGMGNCPHCVISSDIIVKKLENTLKKRDLKSFLKKRTGGSLKMHHELRVSISDCPSSCSRPQIADIGLIGACVPNITDADCNLCETCIETCKEGAISLYNDRPVIDEKKCLYCGQCIDVCPNGVLEKGKTGYRIQLGGKLGRHPRLAEELTGIFEPDDTVRIAKRCLDYYQMHNKQGERFGVILEINGLNELKSFIKT